MTLQIVLTGGLIAFLAALALLWSRWPAWMKGMLVMATTAFLFYFHGAALQLSGWPTRDALPERFVLLAAVFDEPTKGHPGALYVWVNPIVDGKPASQPRAYRLAYSKDLHGLLDEGIKKTRQGVSQVGTATPKKGTQGQSWLRPGSDEQEVKIRDQPVPQLPEK